MKPKAHRSDPRRRDGRVLRITAEQRNSIENTATKSTILANCKRIQRFVGEHPRDRLTRKRGQNTIKQAENQR